jgi:hypothetical protein
MARRHHEDEGERVPKDAFSARGRLLRDRLIVVLRVDIKIHTATQMR